MRWTCYARSVKKTGEIDIGKALASQLAAWDRRIFEIVAISNDEQESDTLNLICSFEPEPTSGTIGYFWLATLLVRMEYENLDERIGIDSPFDLGFKIGGQVYLPDGKSLKGLHDYVVLWPNPDEL